MRVRVSHGKGTGTIHGGAGERGGLGGTAGGVGGAGGAGGRAGGRGGSGGRGGGEGGAWGSQEQLTMGEAQSTYVTTTSPWLIAAEVMPNESGSACSKGRRCVASRPPPPLHPLLPRTRCGSHR